MLIGLKHGRHLTYQKRYLRINRIKITIQIYDGFDGPYVVQYPEIMHRF